MGLTIHTTLTLPRNVTDDEARALVESVHAAATQLVAERGLEKIFPVDLATELPFVSRWVMVELDEHTGTGVEIPILAGWGFLVLVGKDCEPAIFGLCRHPATVKDSEGRTHQTKLGTGWSFQTACKTQYASAHGWAHFEKCHRAVIDLALLWEAAGVGVEIMDEGDYWPGRNPDALRKKLATYNGIVAGLAGAMKDAAEDDGGPSIQSPIFEHPEFERLEAEGVAEHEKTFKEVRKVIGKPEARREE